MFPIVSGTIAAMESENGKRLAQAVVARRTALGMLTTKALAEKAKLSPRMLGDVENARRFNFSDGAKAQIERALEWAPGSIDLLLDGRDPVLLTSAQMQSQNGRDDGPAAGVRHMADHTWSVASEFVVTLVEANPPAALWHQSDRLVSIFGTFIADRVMKSDIPTEDKDAILADLYQKRRQAQLQLESRAADRPPQHQPSATVTELPREKASPLPPTDLTKTAASEGEKGSDGDGPDGEPGDDGGGE